jgi:acyl carrier protein
VKLESLFARVLGVPAESVSEASGPSTISSWDSMATMKLVAALEDIYNITLSTNEIRNFSSIAAARAMLLSRGIVP